MMIRNGIQMLTDSRKIMRRLESEGWVLKRVRGSHHIFKHSESGRPVVVPHPNKSVATGTVRSIYRDAGWEKD
jgi:predicted RNA binding protein YcfA (HicA-like mRNA interferase family)